MEMVFYKCSVCGFTHQVPEYWSGFAPEEKMEMAHINLQTKEMCEEVILELVQG